MARILVVDDSVTLRRMVAQVMKEAGHSVEQAENGEQALRVIAAFNPELVLTDMYMPGMDGIDLAIKIRAMPQFGAIPILVLSTDASTEVKARGKANRVTGWIAKPFDPNVLQSVVEKVLG